MIRKTLTATLTGRGALIAAALALLALAALTIASITYAQSPSPAPTGLTASASESGITLSWTAPDANGVTGYQILRRLSADGWVWSETVYVNDTGDTTTSYTDSDVEAGEEYHYRVKARYGTDIGRWSNGVNVRAAGDDPAPDPTPEPTATPTPEPAPTQAPGRPGNLTAAASSDGITLSWDAPSDGGEVAGYQILRRLSADDWVWSEAVYVDDTGSAATSYTDADVEAGEEYHYRVKARNAAGIGKWSNGVNVEAALPQGVVFIPPLPPSNAQVSQQQNVCNVVWCATMTTDHQTVAGTDVYGWDSDSTLFSNDAITDSEFTFEMQTYGVYSVISSSVSLTIKFLNSQPGDIATQATRDKLYLHVGGKAFNLGAGTYSTGGGVRNILWSDNQGVTWGDGDTVELKIAETAQLSSGEASSCNLRDGLNSNSPIITKALFNDDGTVDLEWTPATTQGLTGFRIERHAPRVSGGDRCQSVGASGRSWSDNSAPDTHLLIYRVYAMYGGTSAPSTSVQAHKIVHGKLSDRDDGGSGSRVQLIWPPYPSCSEPYYVYVYVTNLDSWSDLSSSMQPVPNTQRSIDWNVVFTIDSMRLAVYCGTRSGGKLVGEITLTKETE